MGDQRFGAGRAGGVRPPPGFENLVSNQGIEVGAGAGKSVAVRAFGMPPSHHQEGSGHNIRSTWRPSGTASSRLDLGARGWPAAPAAHHHAVQALCGLRPADGWHKLYAVMAATHAPRIHRIDQPWTRACPRAHKFSLISCEISSPLSLLPYANKKADFV